MPASCRLDGWRRRVSPVRLFARILGSIRRTGRHDVIDLNREAPHWLYRDIGLRDGRATEAEMRRPPRWPDDHRFR